MKFEIAQLGREKSRRITIDSDDQNAFEWLDREMRRVYEN